jgi:type VI secretion system protein VasD
MARAVRLVGLAGLLFLPACGGGPLQMAVIGDPAMNSGGNAAIVRIYQLSGDAGFLGARSDEFWQDDERLLGPDIIRKQQFRLYPDQIETVELQLEKATRFIGVAADLRQPEAKQWRVLLPVSDVRSGRLRVLVRSNRLSVE